MARPELVGDRPHAAGRAGVLVLVGARGRPGAADVLGGRPVPPGAVEHALELRHRLSSGGVLALLLGARVLEAASGGVAERLLAGAGVAFGQAGAEQQPGP